MSWVTIQRNRLLAESIPHDVTECEALIRRHHEYRADINARQTHVEEFVARGQRMIADKHVLASEINTKVA
jgi:hypothetical protein